MRFTKSWYIGKKGKSKEKDNFNNKIKPLGFVGFTKSWYIRKKGKLKEKDNIKIK